MKPSIILSTSSNPIIPSTGTVCKSVPLQYYTRREIHNCNKAATLRLILKAVTETHHSAVHHACSHVVLCNAGYEVPLTGLISRIIRPAYKIVVVDYQMPSSNRYDKTIAKLLSGYSSVVVIRSGDQIPLNGRFGIPTSKMSFVKLPIVGNLPAKPGSLGSYIYSGGTAHRDWVTFCKALDGLSMNSKVVTNTKLSDIRRAVPPNIEEVGLLSPADARKIMEASELVCLSFQDTLLASGPLVLLDAMAAGKAIVATECNATRDYLTHRHNGMFFQPSDHVTLRNEIVALRDDLQLRQHLGTNARQTIVDEHMPKQFYNRLLNILDLA